MAAVIVKLQRPLKGAQRPDLWLAYDESRARKVKIVDTDLPAWVHAAMEGKMKGYFFAAPDLEKRSFTFIGKAEEPSW